MAVNATPGELCAGGKPAGAPPAAGSTERPGRVALLNYERIVGLPSRDWAISRCRLDSDLVVHGGSDSLCAAEIALRGLDRNMAEEKLNLLQFASSGPVEASASSAQVVLFSREHE